MAVERKELLRRTSATTGIPEATVAAVVAGLLEEISAALGGGEAVHLRTFGKFEPRTRPASVRPNPRTGDPMTIPRRLTVGFLPSSTLRAALNA